MSELSEEDKPILICTLQYLMEECCDEPDAQEVFRLLSAYSAMGRQWQHEKDREWYAEMDKIITNMPLYTPLYSQRKAAADTDTPPQPTNNKEQE
jgi:hypothetical protein